MKARVKATGEIVEVMYSHTVQDRGYDIIWYITPQEGCFTKEELEFIDTGESLDYWTRLEHQYAGMAMQGLVANQSIVYGQDFDDALDEHITVNAVAIAHALVQKLKEKEERK